MPVHTIPMMPTKFKGRKSREKAGNASQSPWNTGHPACVAGVRQAALSVDAVKRVLAATRTSKR